MQLFFFLLVGIAAGVLSGILGIGGGILIVPVLIYLFGFSQKNAQGTSIVALLAPVGLFALLEYYKKGNADLKAGALIALGFFAGGYFGALVANMLPGSTLRRVFAVFLIAVAVLMLFSGGSAKERAANQKPSARTSGGVSS